jgi:hypothetical protein
MKHLRFLALGLSLCTLSACQTFNNLVDDVNALELPSFATISGNESTPDQLIYTGNCPQVQIVEELRSMSEFTNPNDMGDHNLISRVDIATVNSSCNNDGKAVTADLKMAFDGLLGPRAGRQGNDKIHFSYPFFVAITDARGRIMAKEIFAANMAYPPGEARHTYHENMRQIIPIEPRDRNKKFKILIGFQLGPDQLAYNRERLAAKKAAAVPIEPQPIITTDPDAPVNLGGQ